MCQAEQDVGLRLTFHKRGPAGFHFSAANGEAVGEFAQGHRTLAAQALTNFFLLRN